MVLIKRMSHSYYPLRLAFCLLMKSCVLLVGTPLNGNAMLLRDGESATVCNTAQQRKKQRLLFSLLNRVNYMAGDKGPLAKWRGTSGHSGL